VAKQTSLWRQSPSRTVETMHLPLHRDPITEAHLSINELHRRDESDRVLVHLRYGSPEARNISRQRRPVLTFVFVSYVRQ